MSFENIVGNKEVKQLLIHSVSTSNILHSYMFVGIDGIGKKIIAKQFIILNAMNIEKISQVQSPY